MAVPSTVEQPSGREKNRPVYVRFSNQIPRTGPGPCYKYLRKLRDRCTDLFLRLASSSRFFSPRRKSPSLLLFPSIARLLFICLDRERKKGRLQERGKKETRTGTSSLLRQERALCRERETSDGHSTLRVASFRAI